MASLAISKNGHVRILFYDTDKKRKAIHLRSCSRKDAETVKAKVEELLYSRLASSAPRADLAAWLSIISEPLRQKLEKVGLIDSAESKKPKVVKLGDYLKGYFESRSMDVKLSSSTVFSHTHKRLVEHFGYDTPISEITAIQARDFRKWLTSTNKRNKAKEGETTVGLAANTVRRRMGFCKQVFGQALEDGIIDRNPFKGIASSVRANKERQVYVDRQTIDQVLAKAPNARWRALIVLARYAALRVPSEIAKLKWDHVQFDKKRILVVDSSKNERHANRAIRRIPMLPMIEAELLAWFSEGPAGEYVFPCIAQDTNLRTTLEKIITRAAVAPWPKLWQNLRASGCTDFARTEPSHIAAAICGHTEQIAREHYWTAEESDLDRIIEKYKSRETQTALDASNMAPNEHCTEDAPSMQDEAFANENTGETTENSTTTLSESGRYWTRTNDPHDVNVVL
jgi:integrase